MIEKLKNWLSRAFRRFYRFPKDVRKRSDERERNQIAPEWRARQRELNRLLTDIRSSRARFNELAKEQIELGRQEFDEGNASNCREILSGLRWHYKTAERIYDKAAYVTAALAERKCEDIQFKPAGRRESNLRLFVLHSSLPEHTAGYTIRTQSILKELLEAGSDICAVTRPGFPGEVAPEPPPIDGVRYMRLSDAKDAGFSDKDFISLYSSRLQEISTDRRPRIIHASSSYVNGLAAQDAAVEMKIPCVYEVRGLWYLSKAVKEPKFYRSEVCRYFKYMETLAMKGASHVVTLSHAMKNELGTMGIPDDKISVIPNAVDTERYKPRHKNIALRKKYNIDNKFVIGFIGSVTLYEGLDLLLDAVHRLAEQYAIALVVAGSGYAEGELREQVKNLGIQEQVQFLGKIDSKDVPHWYAAFDCCAFPRKDFEVCRYVPPMKFLEPMAAGIPVIMSNLPPLIETVKDGETGLVCQTDSTASLASCVEQYINYPELRQRISENARRFVVANRQWKMVAEQIRDLHETLSEPGARTVPTNSALEHITP